MEMKEAVMQTLTRPPSTRQSQPLAFESGTWPEAAAHDVKTWLQALINVWFKG